jgi:hypothetical protein
MVTKGGTHKSFTNFEDCRNIVTWPFIRMLFRSTFWWYHWFFDSTIFGGNMLFLNFSKKTCHIVLNFLCFLTRVKMTPINWEVHKTGFIWLESYSGKAFLYIETYFCKHPGVFSQSPTLSRWQGLGMDQDLVLVQLLLLKLKKQFLLKISNNDPALHEEEICMNMNQIWISANMYSTDSFHYQEQNK